jgi:hypothetical protein
MSALRKCPTCKTRTLVEEGDALVCSTCRGRFEVSAEPKVAKGRRKSATQTNKLGKHRYYENNRDAIIADIATIGKHAAMKKWDIPSGTISYLMLRWRVGESPLPAGAGSSPKDGWLPPLPPFNESWTPEVQVRWLELYEAVLERGKHG